MKNTEYFLSGRIIHWLAALGMGMHISITYKWFTNDFEQFIPVVYIEECSSPIRFEIKLPP